MGNGFDGRGMSRHRGSDDRKRLRISRLIERTAVLGPGERSVVVVQGCQLRCRGCIAESTHRLDGGFSLEVDSLFERLRAVEGIDGVTFTGGEPFLQAGAISRLIDLLRRERTRLSVMSYSGYRLEWLRKKGSPAQLDLLRKLDLLVDGPYVERLHAPLRWRGSRNQRIHQLSGRHRAEVASWSDESAGMEMGLDRELGFEWVGVPPVPDFAARLEAMQTGNRPEPTTAKEQR
jgi:anaerobic ribonucleoside-triphosphate reductase activating protein